MRWQRLVARRPTTRRLLWLAVPIVILSALVSREAWDRAAFLVNTAKSGPWWRLPTTLVVFVSLGAFLFGMNEVGRRDHTRRRTALGWLAIVTASAISAAPLAWVTAVFAVERSRGRSWPELPFELTDLLLFGGASAGLLAVATIAALRPRDPGVEAQPGVGTEPDPPR